MALPGGQPRAYAVSFVAGQASWSMSRNTRLFTARFLIDFLNSEIGRRGDGPWIEARLIRRASIASVFLRKVEPDLGMICFGAQPILSISRNPRDKFHFYDISPF
jgi:hypothetical protein